MMVGQNALLFACRADSHPRFVLTIRSDFLASFQREESSPEWAKPRRAWAHGTGTRPGRRPDAPYGHQRSFMRSRQQVA